MEAASSGEAEDGHRDATSSGGNSFERGFEVVRLQDREGSFGLVVSASVEAAFDAGVGEGGVVGAEVLEGPAEESGVEALVGGDVCGGEFEVRDGGRHGEDPSRGKMSFYGNSRFPAGLCPNSYISVAQTYCFEDNTLQVVVSLLF